MSFKQTWKVHLILKIYSTEWFKELGKYVDISIDKHYLYFS